VNTSVEYAGRVEVYNDGVWGRVCGNNYFRENDAHVFCRMLGYR